ncbi:hypothetical protein TWF506_008150 [Arthrobotrys conoides]|uniref:F-box domain-containing protein n=1 Tax=Arthrobotrys conoides TaxID=74498 RepID=A0AAN8RX65_9PEZI
MLRKAFRKLHLSTADNADERVASVDDEGIQDLPLDGQRYRPGGSTGSLHVSQDDAYDPPIFNLSFDVFEIILRYLSFRDRIALSLTTKGLRHLDPQQNYANSPTSITSSRNLLGAAERACASRIARSLLPLRLGSKFREKISNAGGMRLARDGVFRCPYCFHELCSSTCATALFLDHATGIFYPRSLFPIETAEFYYSVSRYELCLRGVMGDNPEPQGTFYSTIWCEHHRCPRDILINQKKNYNKKYGSGLSRFRFEYEDMKRWQALRVSRQPLATSARTRWLVGYRKQYPLYLIAAAAGLKATNWKERLTWGTNRPAELEKHCWMEPVYEKFFYETICRHCLLPLAYPVATGWRKRYGRYSKWFGETCRCEARKPGGCRRCGVVSVKFTMVEVFDTFLQECSGTDGLVKRSSYWLFLAKECEIVNYPSGQNKYRLEYVDPLEAERQLNIVRGVKVASIARPSPRLGLQDLPYQTILWIMTLHNRANDVHTSRYNEMIQSSYIFLKSWYGDSAAVMARDCIDMSVWRDRINMCWPEARPVNEGDTVRVKCG